MAVRRSLSLAVSAAALAACGERSEALRSMPPPAPPERGGIRPVELEVYRPRPGGRTLDVVYQRGIDERYVRTVMREGPRAVRLGVKVFSPDTQRQAATVLCAAFHLRRPLGDRRVLDQAGRRVPLVTRRTQSDPRDLLLPRRTCGNEQ